jgi:hypothetical protein
VRLSRRALFLGCLKGHYEKKGGREVMEGGREGGRE